MCLADVEENRATKERTSYTRTGLHEFPRSRGLNTALLTMEGNSTGQAESSLGVGVGRR